jgi:hypothetical protein
MPFVVAAQFTRSVLHSNLRGDHESKQEHTVQSNYFLSFGFSGLQTPHVPPLLQCLQYLQFLHALQLAEPVHVAAVAVIGKQIMPIAMTDRRRGFTGLT